MTGHDCDREGCEGVRRRAHVERIEQGLPIGIPDSPALRRTAAIFNNPAGSTSAVGASTTTAAHPAGEQEASFGGFEPRASGSTANARTATKRRHLVDSGTGPEDAAASTHQPSESDEPAALHAQRAV